MTAGGARPRPNSSPNRLSSSARRRMVHRIPFGLELEELVAQHRGQLEVQLFGRGLHLRLEQPMSASRSRASAGRRSTGPIALAVLASATRVVKRTWSTDLTIERGVMSCASL